MEIIYLNLGDIHPYEKNPRNNAPAIDAVAASIKEFGFKVPIIIDKDNVIVAGHTRYKAATKLGYEQVPCIKADDLNEEQIKAFRLADNKVSELAEWDFPLLGEELEGITMDMEQFGFELFGDEEEQEEETSCEEEFDEFEDIEKLDSHYGVPYQGNKSRIADIIISLLPEGNRLVDLFGGGGAITHCALLSGKWYSQLYNDLNPMITTLFMDAVNGKYRDENRVITREDFEDLKDTDPYVKYIWSFGNNGTGYLWGKDIEEIKCQACRCLLSDEVKERRLNYMAFIKLLKNTHCTTLDRLQAIEHLQALTQLEALQRLEVSNIDYRQYQYREGDVVYCDVPYEKLGKEKCDDYGLEFNSLEFYKWCKEQPFQVFFSSYEISDESFYKVKIKSVMSLIGANTNGQKVNEYLYSNKPIRGEQVEASNGSN